MPDHVHLLVRLEPVEKFSDFIRDLKASSSKWAKQKQPKFGWQRRYGGFTVSESVSNSVRNYIRGQKEHHKKQSFRDEYKSLLRLHKIDFDERYLWD
jgi:putative transposase